jgi:hypothetical protein
MYFTRLISEGKGWLTERPLRVDCKPHQLHSNQVLFFFRYDKALHLIANVVVSHEPKFGKCDNLKIDNFFQTVSLKVQSTQKIVYTRLKSLEWLANINEKNV